MARTRERLGLSLGGNATLRQKDRSALEAAPKRQMK